MRIVRILVHFVVLVMSLQSVSPALVENGTTDSLHTSLHAEDQGSLLSLWVLEKTEEEGSTEGRIKFLPVELVDFSHLVLRISEIHEPPVSFLPFEQQHDGGAPLFKLFCVFII